MEKNKKESTNNLSKKSPDSLILRIKRRVNADKNKDRER